MAYLCIRFGAHALPAHVIRMLKERHSTPASPSQVKGSNTIK